jgi:hypothetical protein
LNRVFCLAQDHVVIRFGLDSIRVSRFLVLSVVAAQACVPEAPIDRSHVDFQVQARTVHWLNCTIPGCLSRFHATIGRKCQPQFLGQAERSQQIRKREHLVSPVVLRLSFVGLEDL